MRNYLLPILFLSTSIPALTFGQTTAPFCSAGIQANGYVDLGQLPAAPNFPAGGGTSAPVTVTLPVTSVPGLTVQVTIPAIQSTSAGPAYAAGAGTLTLEGTSVPGYVLMLQFSKPVAAVSEAGSASGRGASFSLSNAPTSNPNSPLGFDNSVSQYTLAPYFFSQTLQYVATDTTQGFTTAYAYSSGPFPSVANIRVQSVQTASRTAVPANGLQLWYKSDTIPNPMAYTNHVWPDSSGNSHDASYTGTGAGPSPNQMVGNNCQRSYTFSTDNYFNFNLPIDGWQQMTVFMVAAAGIDPPAGNYPSYSAAIFWNENAYWGNTFVSPYQTSENFRFGTEQVNNQPIYTRPFTVGQDLTITRAVHNNTTDTLYVNSLLALQQGSKSAVLAGTSGDAYLGRGYNNTYYSGEISEVLVYNRVLSADEAASVESYLRNKFGTH